MNNLLAHILIFQVNEQLREDLSCLFNQSLGFTKSKKESLEEHLSSLSLEKATEHLRDFGYPLNLNECDLKLTMWLSVHLLTVYLSTQEKFNDNFYTSLHCVNCGVASQHLSNPLKSNCFTNYFNNVLLGSTLPPEQRKSLLVVAFASGSSNSVFGGGF